MNAVENELKLAEGVATEVKRVITPLKYPDDEWSTTVAAFIDQAFEHHAAIILLIRSSLFGSAFALLRLLVEIVVRGVWIATCATDAQIKKFREKDEIDPSFGEMAKAIDTTCGIDFFQNLKTSANAFENRRGNPASRRPSRTSRNIAAGTKSRGRFQPVWESARRDVQRAIGQSPCASNFCRGSLAARLRPAPSHVRPCRPGGP
jgi:hypothetical protein